MGEILKIDSIEKYYGNKGNILKAFDGKTTLDYKDVIVISKKILKNNGLLSIVHRPENLMDILMFMRSNNIEPKKIRFVYPYKGKNANILLVEGAKNGKPGLKVMDPLYVYENGNYTEEIKKYFE